MATRFSVNDCEVGVALAREGEELHLARVIITLSGKDVFKNPYTIEEHFATLLGCECVVVVG